MAIGDILYKPKIKLFSNQRGNHYTPKREIRPVQITTIMFVREIQAITDAAGNVTTPASFVATMTIAEVIELCFTSAGKKITSEHIGQLKSVFTATELAPLAEFFIEVRKREAKAKAKANAINAAADVKAAADMIQAAVAGQEQVIVATRYYELQMPNGVRAVDFSDYVAQTGNVPSIVMVGITQRFDPITRQKKAIRVQAWINSGLADIYATATAPEMPKSFYCSITSRVKGQKWYDSDGNEGGEYTKDIPYHIEGSSVLFMPTLDV